MIPLNKQVKKIMQYADLNMLTSQTVTTDAWNILN